MNHAPPALGDWEDPEDPTALPEPLRGLRVHRPRPLPVDLDLPTRTHRNLAEAEHALGSLNEAAERIANRPMLVLGSQIHDARSSAAMAGVDSDLVEALMFHLLLGRTDGDSLPELISRHPVGRFIVAAEYGSRQVAAGVRIDGHLLGAISALMTGRPDRDLAAGLRSCQGWLGGRDMADAYLLTVPPGDGLRVAVADWSEQVHAAGPLSRLARIALAHLHLELLQPYPEANGHLARLFSSLEMVRTGLLRDQILPLSYWLDTHRRQYHEHIQAVVHNGPVHEWIDFFAEGVRRQALAQLALIDELDGLRRRHIALVPRPLSAHRVAADLVTTPMLTHRTIVERYGVTTTTAIQVTGHLMGLGLLSALDDRVYDKVFVSRPVLRALTTERPVEQSNRDGEVFTDRT